jgi:hypothetical protein
MPPCYPLLLEAPLLTLLALLTTEPARAETGTPLDTGESVSDNGCGKSSQQGAVFFGLLVTIGAGMTVGRRDP